MSLSSAGSTLPLPPTRSPSPPVTPPDSPFFGPIGIGSRQASVASSAREEVPNATPRSTPPPRLVRRLSALWQRHFSGFLPAAVVPSNGSSTPATQEEEGSQASQGGS